MKSLLPLLTIFCFSTVARSAPTELEGERAAATAACPTPEEARAKMTVPEGYEVRCFAHEPMVVNPVAMTWDARGRLWVVEAFEYPEGTPLPVEKRPFGGDAKDDRHHPVPAICLPKSEISDLESQIPKDRVVILEDTDNDGDADKRTVFVEGLNLASAIICGDDGIYVGQQPHLIHFRDADGDDKPDAWRVVLTGFGREDTHELVNSFCWGPDGWLYMTHGVFTHSKVRRPGQPESEGFKFDAGIGRARPMSVVQPSRLLKKDSAETAEPHSAPSWEFEVFADGTSNPWGCDYDAAGNFFVSACVIDHFFHMAPGGIYVRQGGAPENPYAYEQLPSIVKHKHFRAAYAGVQIYQGGRYPADTHGHAFIGNIHDNAIHEEVLTPVGSTFKCEPRRDFLRANNGWFRPVSTQTGPDGFLWIMDWCDKYPCYQNAKANPAGVDRDRGRIWRVVHRGAHASSVPNSASLRSSKPNDEGDRIFGKDAKSDTLGSVRSPDASRPTKDMDLAKLTTAELVKLLEHPNNWMQRTARRALGESFDASAYLWGDAFFSGDLPMLINKDVSPSELMARLVKSNTVVDDLWRIAGSSSEWLAMEALWTLQRLGPLGWDPAQLDELCKSNSPKVRAWVARMTAEYRNNVSYQSVNLFSAGTPGLFGKNTSFSTGFRGAEKGDDALKRLAALATDADPAVRLAVAVALRQHSAKYLVRTSPRGYPDIEVFLAYADLIRSSKDDTVGPLPFVIWSGLEPLMTHMLQQWEGYTSSNSSRFLLRLGPLLAESKPLGSKLARKVCHRLADEGFNGDGALQLISLWPTQDDMIEAGLEGVLEGQTAKPLVRTEQKVKAIAAFEKRPSESVRFLARTLGTLWGDEESIKALVTLVRSESIPIKKRIEALHTASSVRPYAGNSSPITEVLQLAESLIRSSPDPDLRTEAIQAARRMNYYTSADAMIEGWKTFNPVQRALALDAMTHRGWWAVELLKAVQANSINKADVPLSVVLSLSQMTPHGDPDDVTRVHRLVEKVFGKISIPNVGLQALMVQKRKMCLEGEPDLANGKTLFTATCAVCHTFHGGGQKVGPDLIGSGRSNLDALLANVIDPNQIIGNGYENFTITTKDNRTLAGRVTEDTPSHVKLLAIGGAETVVPRDQIAKLENTHQSLMPMGFGNLPDAAFRDIIWYLLAPPEEGPLTPEKKKLLIQGVEVPETAAKPKGTNWRAIDWESVSLWNPDWKVAAPEFERTPVKLAEYHGKTNVLLLHPFPDKKTPASIERKVKIEQGKTKLHFAVAADDRGDWKLKALVNGQAVKEMEVDHEQPRWKDVDIDLSKWQGQEITIRLEAHATGWSWEFGCWQGIELR